MNARQIAGRSFKALAFLLLILCGMLFGTDALDNGKLPMIAIGGFGVAFVAFLIGDKFDPSN